MTDPGPHRPSYQHLFERHEVSTLPHTLKDLGQVGIDESVIWRAGETSGRVAGVQRLPTPAPTSPVSTWWRHCPPFWLEPVHHRPQASG